MYKQDRERGRAIVRCFVSGMLVPVCKIHYIRYHNVERGEHRHTCSPEYEGPAECYHVGVDLSHTSG